jgi:hypothetical protein
MSAQHANSGNLNSNWRFAAEPYRAEGGFSLPGFVLAFLLTILGAVLAGSLAGWVSKWFYLVLLFPGGIGVLVGLAGAAGASWGKLRNRGLAMFLGIDGACVALAVVHYVMFRHFLAELEKTMPGAAELRFSWPALVSFIDQSAVAGVEIIDRGNKPMNLGYYGSYIYWLLEIVLVAVIAGAIIASRAAEPFCTACQSWKTVRPLGRIQVPRDVALEVITSGELGRLAGHNVGVGPGRLSLEAAVCSDCGSAATVDISFKEVTVDNKGTEKLTKLAHVTYPGEALPVLEGLFATSRPGALSSAEPPTLARRAADVAAQQGERIALTPVKTKHQGDTWELQLGEEEALLVDSEQRVMAVLPRHEAAERFVFPSFWQSVTNLGILTDEGKVAWFRPKKSAIKQIKYYLQGQKGSF